MNEEILNNYYLRKDEEGRLTLEIVADKTMEECVKLTMECINELLSVEPKYNSKASRSYFQPNSDPAKAHKNGYKLGVRETLARIRGKS